VSDLIASPVDPTPGLRGKPTPVRSASRRRVVGGTLLVAAVAASMTVGVRALPADGIVPSLAAFALGLAIVPLVGSVLEWFVHRFVYHEPVVPILAPIFTVHTAHHYSFFPTWRYITRGPARRLAITKRAPDIHTSTARNAGVRLAHFGWYMAIGVVMVWIPAWLATGNSAFLIGIVISSIVVSNLFIVVHDTIHRPGSHRLVESQPWFGFLDRHHYIHHVDLGANLNFLLPLADLLFGSLRTQMTQDEIARHGTLTHAKSRPFGEGERARNAVVE
jgi:hypothetical protein